jgi:hypothetical protein
VTRYWMPAVLVCEDLFDEKERKRDAFQIHRDRFHRLQFQCVHSLVTPLLFGIHTQRHFAIAFETNSFLSVSLTKFMFSAEAYQISLSTYLNGILFFTACCRRSQHILGFVRPSFFFSVFGVRVAFGFASQLEPDRQRDTLAVV